MSTPAIRKSGVLRGLSARTRAVGGRKGWRLPSFVELASLVDPNATSDPFLPAGHPFTNIQSDIYWSATTTVDSLTPLAWAVDFFFGSVITDAKASGTHFIWCVRGPMNADQY